MALVLDQSEEQQGIDLSAHGTALDIRQRPLTIYAEYTAAAGPIWFLFSHGRDASGGGTEYGFVQVTADNLRGRWYNATGGELQVGAAATNGVFHRVCFVVQASPSTTARMFVDGALEASGDTGPTVDTSDENDLTAIGFDPDGSGFDFSGPVANVAVWDVDLSQSDAEDLTAGLITPADLPEGLLGYWPLDYDARDESGNGLHGTVVGSPVFTEDPPAPVAEYGFNEGSGSITEDSSGNGHNANILGASWVPHDGGFALQYDGDDRCNIPDDESFDLNNAFTLMAWVRPSGLKTHGIIQKRSSTSDGWDLSISSGGVPFLRINQATNGNDLRVNAAGSIPHGSGTWTHIAGTFDGSDLRIYVNGELEGTLAVAEPVASNSHDVWIGNSSSVNGGFDGLIDDVRVFDVALSEAEIQLLMATPVGEAPELEERDARSHAAAVRARADRVAGVGSRSAGSHAAAVRARADRVAGVVVRDARSHVAAVGAHAEVLGSVVRAAFSHVRPIGSHAEVEGLGPVVRVARSHVGPVRTRADRVAGAGSRSAGSHVAAVGSRASVIEGVAAPAPDRLTLVGVSERLTLRLLED